MIIDFRVRVPLRDTDADPRVEVPEFMARYNAVLGYEEHVNRPVTALLTEMDDAGIWRAVLQAEYEWGSLDVCRQLNNRCAEIVGRYPDRFVGFATVDPRCGMDAVRELDRAVKGLGLKGLNLQPCFLGLLPTDPLFYPLYAKCVEYDIPVTLHTGINYSATHPMDPDRPIHIDKVACHFPELKIVCSHGGWPWTAEMAAVARKHPNVYIEFGAVAPKYIAMPRAGWDPMFQYANSLLQDQILFATDWPMFPFERAVREFREAGLKPQVLEKLFFRNASRLLGIQEAAGT